MRNLRISAPELVALLFIVSLHGLLSNAGLFTSAAPAQAVGPRFVATTGVDSGDCSDSLDPCATIQYAVDQADDGDEVRVAAGIYTDIHLRGGTTQTVFLSKSLTIRGGYSVGDWHTFDPESNLTTLDAQRQGRLFTIKDTDAAVIGLRMINAEAKPFGNSAIFGQSSNITLTSSIIAGSTGAGVYLYQLGGPVNLITIRANRIISNTGPGIVNNSNGFMLMITDNTISNNGGGIAVGAQYLNLVNNLISGNASNLGIGGVSLIGTNGTVMSNTIFNNAGSRGGGLHLNGYLTVTANTISNNWALLGGGLYLAGSFATLSGNRIISNTAFDDGGGLYADDLSTYTMTTNMIISNSARFGAGAFTMGGSTYPGRGIATLISNTIASNRSMAAGGGLYLENNPAVVVGNNFIGNSAFGDGGALYLLGSAAKLGCNAIENNDATAGGGIYVNNSPALFIANSIVNNRAAAGGGVAAYRSPTTFRNNIVMRNYAGPRGTVGSSILGGLGLGGGFFTARSNLTLTNDVVADNTSYMSRGNAMYLEMSAAQLLNTTIARNDGSDEAIALGFSSMVAMTNTILVGHTIGISVPMGSSATLNGVLWYANDFNIRGGGQISMSNAYTGDPAFLADGYHLSAVSAAIDRGVDAGVTIDIDGDARPFGAAPDLGADEYVGAPPTRTYLPFVAK